MFVTERSWRFFFFGPTSRPAFILIAYLLVMCLLPAFAQAPEQTKAQSNTAPCIDCIRIRAGLPRVVQGPGPGIPDNLFNEIQLPDGRFRGFSANSITYAIDGRSPFDMVGKPMPVLGPSSRGQYGESGEWINHVERSGNRLLGWVHDETGVRRALSISDGDSDCGAGRPVWSVDC